MFINSLVKINFDTSEDIMDPLTEVQTMEDIRKNEIIWVSGATTSILHDLKWLKTIQSREVTQLSRIQLQSREMMLLVKEKPFFVCNMKEKKSALQLKELCSSIMRRIIFILAFPVKDGKQLISARANNIFSYFVTQEQKSMMNSAFELLLRISSVGLVNSDKPRHGSIMIKCS